MYLFQPFKFSTTDWISGHQYSRHSQKRHFNSHVLIPCPKTPFSPLFQPSYSCAMCVKLPSGLFKHQKKRIHRYFITYILYTLRVWLAKRTWLTHLAQKIRPRIFDLGPPFFSSSIYWRRSLLWWMVLQFWWCQNVGVTMAKIRHLIAILHSECNNHKVIVVSQFTSMLDLIEPFLRKENFVFTRYDGTCASLERLRTNAKTRILLYSLKCGSLGGKSHRRFTGCHYSWAVLESQWVYSS